MKTVGGILLAAFCGAGLAHGAVVDLQPNGFDLDIKVHIAASPQKVYETLIKPGPWWNGRHSFSGDAKNLTIDARAGGCFCETLPNGGSVQHAVVVYAQPGQGLTMRGALGPFQGQGIEGAIVVTLKASGDGTDLELENSMGGYMKGGFGAWPKLADAVWMDQMTRLKAYVETGAPEAKTPAK